MKNENVSSESFDAYSSQIVQAFLAKLAKSLARASTYDDGFHREDISHGIHQSFSEILDTPNETLSYRKRMEFVQLKDYFWSYYHTYLKKLEKSNISGD